MELRLKPILDNGRKIPFSEFEELLTFRPNPTPVGRFTYHPDSGFRGYAALVQLQRRGVRTERHSLHDSAQHLYRSSAEVSDSVATKEAHTVDRREKRHTPWRWLAAALLLVLAMGFLAWRFFR